MLLRSASKPAVRSFIPRDVASSEEFNPYSFVYNKPINKIDYLGLSSCCDKDDCKKKLQNALQDPKVSKLIKEAKKLKHWWGMPCFGRVRCSCLCADGVQGWADPISGDALVCANASENMNQSTFNDVVKEEVAHQMLMCGDISDWLWSCGGCMTEEKRAKYLAGLCQTDAECSWQAWSTCGSHLGCQGKSWDDFLGVGWPPDLEDQNPL